MCGPFSTWLVTICYPCIWICLIFTWLITGWWHVGCLKCMDKIIWVQMWSQTRVVKQIPKSHSICKIYTTSLHGSFPSSLSGTMLLGGIKDSRWDMQVPTRINLRWDAQFPPNIPGGIRSWVRCTNPTKDPGWDAEIPHLMRDPGWVRIFIPDGKGGIPLPKVGSHHSHLGSHVGLAGSHLDPVWYFTWVHRKNTHQFKQVSFDVSWHHFVIHNQDNVPLFYVLKQMNDH